MEIRRCGRCKEPYVVPSIPWPVTVGVVILIFLACVLVTSQIHWKMYRYDSLPTISLTREHFDKFKPGMNYVAASYLTPLGPGIQTYAREVVETEAATESLPVELISRDQIGNEMRLYFKNDSLTRKEFIWSIKNMVTKKKICENVLKAVGLE